MSVERIISCDAEGCGGDKPPTSQRLSAGSKIPRGWHVLRTESHVRHYCSPNCVLRELAKFPPNERIELL